MTDNDYFPVGRIAFRAGRSCDCRAAVCPAADCRRRGQESSSGGAERGEETGPQTDREHPGSSGAKESRAVQNFGCNEQTSQEQV